MSLMKSETKENIVWISGIIILVTAAILFINDAEDLTILPGISANPHIAAITLTIIGVFLVAKGRNNLQK